MTAIDWLVEKVNSDCLNSTFIRKELIDEAKEMEKQQIINTFKDAQVLKVMEYETRAEQYYNETYVSKGSVVFKNEGSVLNEGSSGPKISEKEYLEWKKEREIELNRKEFKIRTEFDQAKELEMHKLAFNEWYYGSKGSDEAKTN